jgi:hypothetical protein
MKAADICFRTAITHLSHWASVAHEELLLDSELEGWLFSLLQLFQPLPLMSLPEHPLFLATANESTITA